MPKHPGKDKDKKTLPDNLLTPMGVTVGQVRNILGGSSKPEDAPAPAEEHKDKAKALGEKSGEAIEREKFEKRRNKPFAE